MSEFKSYLDYHGFAYRAQLQTRYVRSAKDHAFIEALIATSAPRKRVLGSDKVLWRARIGCEWRPIRQGRVVVDHEPFPFGATGILPPKHQAPEGRANPKGIPYVYLSNNKETAIAEVRPWMRAEVTVGEFRIVRPLNLIDCSRDKQILEYLDGDSLDAAGREASIWGEICADFSRPITNTDATADYVPTQILAEVFKVNGHDGLAYKSAFREDGYNVVLFDRTLIELRSAAVHFVTKVRYESHSEETQYVRPRPKKRSKDDK